MDSCKIEEMFDVFWGLNFLQIDQIHFSLLHGISKTATFVSIFHLFLNDIIYLSPDLRFCPVVRKKSTHPYVLVYSVYRILMCIHLYNNMQ